MENYIELVKKVLLLGKKQIASKGSHRQLINQHWLHSFRGSFSSKENLDTLLTCNNFPLLTQRKMAFHAIKGELFWYFTGSSNLSFLHERNIHIWDKFANSFNEVGPTYPIAFNYLGQIDKICANLKHPEKRYSRKLFADFWLNEYANFGYPSMHYQQPCITNLQFLVETSNKGTDRLNCIVTQRSCDVMLGLPWDIATYSLLFLMVAHYANIQPDNLYFNIGSTHIYENHIEEAQRLVKTKSTNPSQLILTKKESNSPLFTMTYDEGDITLNHYKPSEGTYNFVLNV